MEDSKKKWILFAALAVIVIGLVAVLIVTVFKPAGPAAPSENSVSAVIPDGEASRMEDSKSKVYRGSTGGYLPAVIRWNGISSCSSSCRRIQCSGRCCFTGVLTRPIASRIVCSGPPFFRRRSIPADDGR